MSKIPPELEAEMTPAVKAAFLALLDRIDQLEAQVETLVTEVQTLNGQLEKPTPRNSSLPPSSEHPHAKPPRKPSGGKKRKQGGQKGHKRHLRELIPSENCTSVTPCHPTACRRCGGEVELDASLPARHQVWELPEIEPIVNEYQRYRGHCPGCGITTLAPLPQGVPSGQCGPRLAAFTGLLMGPNSRKYGVPEQTPHLGLSWRLVEHSLQPCLDGKDSNARRRGRRACLRKVARRALQAETTVRR